jgi:TonB family protein
VIEAPKVDIAQAPNPMAGTIPNLPGPPAPTPPPPPQPAQKPKLTFETPGVPTMKPPGLGRIEPPKSGIEEAMRNAARPGPGGIRVGDAGVDADVPGGIGQLPGQPDSAPRQASSLELLSDPMGVDFRPYLIRVLAAVRRNWFAVIPESAHYGRRGKVVLQFSISRTGTVPKLVIVMPSGTEAFDRAAVAGISASNPFPPLPDGFQGDQIRLQMGFSYNMPTR